MDIDDPKVFLEGQGHRSKVKVTRSKNVILTILQVIFEVKGHMGQGQRSHGSRSKVNLEGQGQCHQVKM